MEKPVKNKVLAFLRDQNIEAAVYGLFRFENKAQATKRLEELRARYVVPKQMFKEFSKNEENLILWVRGFEIQNMPVRSQFLLKKFRQN
jgi:hypothetical protein